MRYTLLWVRLRFLTCFRRQWESPAHDTDSGSARQVLQAMQGSTKRWFDGDTREPFQLVL
jgi:hypothetical protein